MHNNLYQGKSLRPDSRDTSKEALNQNLWLHRFCSQVNSTNNDTAPEHQSAPSISANFGVLESAANYGCKWAVPIRFFLPRPSIGTKSWIWSKDLSQLEHYIILQDFLIDTSKIGNFTWNLSRVDGVYLTNIWCWKLDFVLGCTCIFVIDCPRNSSGIDLKGNSWPWTDFSFSLVNFYAPSSVEWKKKVGCRQCKFLFLFQGGVSFFMLQMWGVNFVRHSGVRFFSEQIFGVVSFAAMWAWGGEYFCEIVQGGVKKCRHVHQMIMTHYYNHTSSPILVWYCHSLYQPVAAD
jgi:hypothetical protein